MSDVLDLGTIVTVQRLMVAVDQSENKQLKRIDSSG